MARALRIVLALAVAAAAGWFGRDWLLQQGAPPGSSAPLAAASATPAPASATGADASADSSPSPSEEEPPESAPPGGARERRAAHVVPIEDAIARHSRGAVVEFGATVSRLLADDRRGLQHQRFLVRLPSGTTILVAHNTDVAPRVPVAVGSAVEIRGRYVWNPRGGVVHWTHHDPEGRFAGGWIELAGKTYQ